MCGKTPIIHLCRYFAHFALNYRLILFDSHISVGQNVIIPANYVNYISWYM